MSLLSTEILATGGIGFNCEKCLASYHTGSDLKIGDVIKMSMGQARTRRGNEVANPNLSIWCLVLLYKSIKVPSRLDKMLVANISANH